MLDILQLKISWNEQCQILFYTVNTHFKELNNWNPFRFTKEMMCIVLRSFSLSVTLLCTHQCLLRNCSLIITNFGPVNTKTRCFQPETHILHKVTNSIPCHQQPMERGFTSTTTLRNQALSSVRGIHALRTAILISWKSHVALRCENKPFYANLRTSEK